MGEEMRLLSVLLLCVVVLLAGCSLFVPGMKPEEFKDKTLKLVPEEYFLGATRGHGVFFNRFGNLKTSFTVDLEGAWDGSKILSLKESLRYEDGTKSDRTFTITKLSEHEYSVEMADLEGPGKIEVFGNCMRWSYRLRQDVGGGKIVTLTFDDWMFLQEDGVILNRAYASKLGIDLGEVFMSVRKQG